MPAHTLARRPLDEDSSVFCAVYSNVPVYETIKHNVVVMRRIEDDQLNATQILKLAGLAKSQRTKVLESQVHSGEHEKVQEVMVNIKAHDLSTQDAIYSASQNNQAAFCYHSWVPFETGRNLAIQFKVYDLIEPLLTFTSGTDPLYKRASYSKIDSNFLEFEPRRRGRPRKFLSPDFKDAIMTSPELPPIHTLASNSISISPRSVLKSTHALKSKSHSASVSTPSTAFATPLYSKTVTPPKSHVSSHNETRSSSARKSWGAPRSTATSLRASTHNSLSVNIDSHWEGDLSMDASNSEQQPAPPKHNTGQKSRKYAADLSNTSSMSSPEDIFGGESSDNSIGSTVVSSYSNHDSPDQLSASDDPDTELYESKRKGNPKRPSRRTSKTTSRTISPVHSEAALDLSKSVDIENVSCPTKSKSKYRGRPNGSGSTKNQRSLTIDRKSLPCRIMKMPHRKSCTTDCPFVDPMELGEDSTKRSPSTFIPAPISKSAQVATPAERCREIILGIYVYGDDYVYETFQYLRDQNSQTGYDFNLVWIIKDAEPSIGQQHVLESRCCMENHTETNSVAAMIEEFVNAQDSFGQTALHVAVRFRNHRLIQMLLRAGARRDICDKTAIPHWGLRAAERLLVPELYDIDDFSDAATSIASVESDDDISTAKALDAITRHDAAPTTNRLASSRYEVTAILKRQSQLDGLVKVAQDVGRKCSAVMYARRSTDIPLGIDALNSIKTTAICQTPAISTEQSSNKRGLNADDPTEHDAKRICVLPNNPMYTLVEGIESTSFEFTKPYQPCLMGDEKQANPDQPSSTYQPLLSSQLETVEHLQNQVAVLQMQSEILQTNNNALIQAVHKLHEQRHLKSSRYKTLIAWCMGVTTHTVDTAMQHLSSK
ncbi:hypothetical protein BSLG_005800 [Batrachochytrium salamandrivorans]|nr:hypothetical protein BSLG_005800 [Batrachochytrium salamandrivorans]